MDWRRPTKQQQATQQQLATRPKTMTTQLVFAIVCHLALVSTLALASMSLPDGIENILGFVPVSNFRCERDGYFGDIDNDCRIFHLCQKQVSSGGKVEWRHWTYACGNQTMFNQLTLTCAFVDEAIPCRHASQFQYLNEVIHKPREPFLTDADVTSGISYYTNRVMSDGARNRAFEDSNLMAQLGGSATPTTSNNFVSTNQHFQPQNSNLNLNFFQRPSSFFQDQFDSNQPAAAAIGDDTDDSSSRTINSIELPPQPAAAPLVAAFQSLSRQATQSDYARQASDRRSQDLVLINHSSQQQQQQQQQLPQLQFFAFPPERFNPPPAAATTTTTTATASAPQQQAQVAAATTPSAAGESVAPSAGPTGFNFAVSTDHQLGSSSSFTVNSQQQLQGSNLLNNNFQLQNQVPTTQTTTSAAAASSPQVPSQATQTPPTTISFSPELQPQTTPVAATSTSPDPTTTTGSTSTSAPTTTTTTTTAQTISTSQPARAGSGSRQRARTQTRTRNVARGDSGPLPIDAHPMRHFQSNRLSSMKQQQQQPAPAESAVVMRRQAPSASPVPAASAPVSASQQVSDEQSGFWRRPFDVQLQPRFESLLTRRRV